MQKIIQQTRKLFLSAQGGMFSSAIILSFMIIVSRIFGFMRYRILAGYFNKDELDIFFASFRIPDLVFELIITGAITSTLIPIFIKYSSNEKERSQIISSIINIIFIVLGVLIVLILPFMEPIVAFITPGFRGDKLHTIVVFSQWLLVSQLPFLVLGNFLTGIAQARKQFLITTLPPIIYNLSVIVATVALTPSIGLYAPILGVIGGALLFTIIQLPVVIDELKTYKFTIELHTGVNDFFRMIGPRILTIITAQIDATIDLTLTTLLGSGAYTIFYFAQHLQLLPVSVIGMSFGQASLPYLSELAEAKKQNELTKIVTESILNVFFMTMPIAMYFIFARTPLTRMFFGGEKFDWEGTVQTAFLLSYFAVSIPFHSIYYLLTRSFYALLDSRTPFFASTIGVVTNTVLSLVFILILKMPVWALGVSFSVSMIVQDMILFVILHKKIGFNLIHVTFSIMKISFAALISAPIPYILIKLMDNLLLDTTRTINIFLLLCVSMVVYGLLYLFVSWFIGVQELYIISQLIGKAKQFQKKITEMYLSYD